MLSHELVRAEKKSLRLKMRDARAGVLASGRDRISSRLAVQAAGFLAPFGAMVVSAFCSMPDEFDTAPLLERLDAEGLRLCLPVMQGKDKPLAFRAWSPGDAMDTGTWGIREPRADKPVVHPQLLLVPLLAFDRHGWRLGYGGGFFDRTLRAARANGSATAVGIGLDEQEVDAVPHLDYDEPLDWVLTPSGPRRCERQLAG